VRTLPLFVLDTAQALPCACLPVLFCRAELVKTQADLMETSRMIADLDARAILGEATRQAEWNFDRKYIGRGYADWLHKSAVERAELEVEYNTVS
jgi:hypothetical protein